MSEFKVRVHTLKFAFGQGSQEPSDAEMFGFCRDWQMPPNEIYSIHRDTQAKAIFVKFKSERQMKAVKDKLQPVMNFNYSNGTSINVLMSEADETFKYVRIFNLPPEIEDKEIHQVLSVYGVVRQQIRERYHEDTGFPVFSTVRGAYMEITKELPAQIRVRHFQARVYYDGLVNKCFICKSTEHVKANCPRKFAKPSDGNGKSFSSVLAGTSLLPAFAKGDGAPPMIMTLLQSNRNQQLVSDTMDVGVPGTEPTLVQLTPPPSSPAPAQPSLPITPAQPSLPISPAQPSQPISPPVPMGPPQAPVLPEGSARKPRNKFRRGTEGKGEAIPQVPAGGSVTLVQKLRSRSRSERRPHDNAGQDQAGKGRSASRSDQQEVTAESDADFVEVLP